MSQKEKLLRNLPGVDILLQETEIGSYLAEFDHQHIVDIIRSKISDLRQAIMNETITSIDQNDIKKEILLQLSSLKNFAYRNVINGTGIILHTNLGRAPLGKNIIEKSLEIFEGYSNLEFDLETGKRGSRKISVRQTLKMLTGADDIAVVNNNAAAVHLCLKIFGEGGEVIVSRGELIEIGGSFRVPDIMEQSGAKMIEVGTTNRTKLSDYEKAITPQTKILFKAHQSNFYQEGFTEEVGIQELTQLADKHDLLFIYDIGCGLIKNYPSVKKLDQPSVEENINLGAHLVLFSGDKLLGGPQCGIIAGKQNLINQVDKHPLMRAFRVGKLTLSTLQAALSFTASENNLNNIPFFYFLNRSKDLLKGVAEMLTGELEDNIKIDDLSFEIVASIGKCGGGTTPHLKLESYSIKIKHPSLSAQKLYLSLLKSNPPIVGNVKDGHFYINLFCIEQSQIKTISQSLNNSLCDILL